MRIWYKRSRRSLSFFAASLIFAACLASPFQAVEAATSCGTPVSEAGGTHQRCQSPNGVFHTWKPSGFDASKPGSTVIYVHGYSDQCAKPSTQDADDGVPDTWFNTTGAVYVDAVWSAHNLATQFKNSNLPNTLFLATQAPTCGTNITPKDKLHVDNNEHWPTFSTLLSDLQGAGIARPAGPIILIGHSGAYRELSDWQNGDSAITHIIHLDTLYVTDGFGTWLNGAGHTATVVATAGETKNTADGIIAGVTGAVKLNGLPGSLSGMGQSAQKARVLYAISTELTHMGLVESGTVIPMLLQRVALAGTGTPGGGPTPPTPTPTPTPTSGGTAPGTPTPSVTYDAPRLEIPIPYVQFSRITNSGAAITVPWIGQYIQGVYTFLLGIVGLVAAVMMIIGGFQYLTSAGDKGKLAAGKKRITDALIGMVLAFGSYVILFTINPALVTFPGLQLATVTTEQFGGAVDGNSAPPAQGAAPQTPGNLGDLLKRVCKTVEDCLPKCAAAGCTTVSTYGRKDYLPESGKLPGFEGVTFKAINGPFGNDCKKNAFPDLPSAPRSPIPAMTHVVPNGNQASQAVIEGLQRASLYIDQHFPGQDIKITVSNCFRDARTDFGAQCAIIMRTTNNDPSTQANGSTWPGPNPHSSGYACDLGLLENGQQTSCDGIGDYQYQCKFKSADDKLVQILTDPSVGGRRLTYECWHFEFGSPYNSRCIGSQCNSLDEAARKNLKISCS